MYPRGCVLALAALLALLPVAALSATPLTPQYNSYAPIPFVANDTEGVVLRLVNLARYKAGLPLLELELTLSRIAREHSADMAKYNYFDANSPMLGSMEYRFHRAGVSTTSPQISIHAVADLDSLMSQLQESKHPFHLEPGSHIGIGVHSVSNPSGHYVTLILISKRTSLEPFPIMMAVGEEATLSGYLLAGFSHPHLLVTPPGGVVYEVPLKIGDRRETPIEARLRFGPPPGEYTAQLSAQGPQGPLTTDTMRIYVDVPYPAPEVSLPPRATGADPVATMLMLLNGDRAQYGLKSVNLDNRLSSMAQAHSEDMAANHFFAHVSPATGDIANRLKNAGIDLFSFAENLSLAPSVVEAEKGLMNSPSHRRNILEPSFTLVGIGVKADGNLLYITQVFGQEHKIIDPRTAATDLLNSINVLREQAGRPSLAVNYDFDAIALENSKAMQRDDALKTDDARALIKQRQSRFASCEVYVYLSEDVPPAQRLAKAVTGDFDIAGIAVFQGDCRAKGRKMLWTTVILMKR